MINYGKTQSCNTCLKTAINLLFNNATTCLRVIYCWYCLECFWNVISYLWNFGQWNIVHCSSNVTILSHSCSINKCTSYCLCGTWVKLGQTWYAFLVQTQRSDANIFIWIWHFFLLIALHWRIDVYSGCLLLERSIITNNWVSLHISFHKLNTLMSSNFILNTFWNVHNLCASSTTGIKFSI